MGILKIPSAFERLTGASVNLPEALDFEGWKWRVGKPTRQAEYPINLEDLIRFYPLVVKHINQNIEELPERITVSLPAETYFEDNLSGKRIQNEIKERIKEETGKEVIVLPQGVIALTKIYLEGKLSPEKTLVIDGGFNTINIAITDKDGEIAYTRTYYNEFGIRDLLENYFKPELKRKYPEVTSNLQKLKEIFLTEEIDIGLKVLDIRNEKHTALKTFITRLFDRIMRDIERAGENFTQFTIIGGLSYYVPDIDTNKPHFIPQENGEFYTVMGMKEYAGMPSIDFGFGDIKIDL